MTENKENYPAWKEPFHLVFSYFCSKQVVCSLRIYDNSPADNWPTRQLSDGYFSLTTNSRTRPLADTSHRQFFKKSPTLTDTDFPRKRMKRNIFFNVNIALFSERTHHHFAFSKHKCTNTCTCVMASFSLYGYWNKVYSPYPYPNIQSFNIHTW